MSWKENALNDSITVVLPRDMNQMIVDSYPARIVLLSEQAELSRGRKRKNLQLLKQGYQKKLDKAQAFFDNINKVVEMITG